MRVNCHLGSGMLVPLRDLERQEGGFAEGSEVGGDLQAKTDSKESAKPPVFPHLRSLWALGCPAKPQCEDTSRGAGLGRREMEVQ